MNKVVFAGLALILARDCDIGGPRFRGPIEGTWGGENAGLIAFDTTAHVHIGCTAGDTKQALVADEQGRFDTPGRYNITLYPVARGMVGTARHRIERDVVPAVHVEPALIVRHDRLLRVPRGAADVDVSGRVERHQYGVVPAPRSQELPVEQRERRRARDPTPTVAQPHQRQTSQDGLVHRSTSLPSTPAPSRASQAALPPGPPRSAPPPPPRN